MPLRLEKGGKDTLACSDTVMVRSDDRFLFGKSVDWACSRSGVQAFFVLFCHSNECYYRCGQTFFLSFVQTTCSADWPRARMYGPDPAANRPPPPRCGYSTQLLHQKTVNGSKPSPSLAAQHPSCASCHSVTSLRASFASFSPPAQCGKLIHASPSSTSLNKTFRGKEISGACVRACVHACITTAWGERGVKVRGHHLV
jgi:hypothetical protein